MKLQVLKLKIGLITIAFLNRLFDDITSYVSQFNSYWQDSKTNFSYKLQGINPSRTQ